MTDVSETPGSGDKQAALTHAAAGTDPDVLAVSVATPAENEQLVSRPTGDEEPFGPDVVAEAEELARRYPQSRSALLPMLHLVQSVQGYVSQQGISFCAQQLDLTAAEVSAVVTFYSMYKRKPCGRYLVSVCTNTMCAMLGGDEIYRGIAAQLGGDTPLGHEETVGTPGAAGSVTLEHAECLAACDLGPVLQVNYEYYDEQTPQRARELVEALRADEPPEPSRGATVTTFTATERQLAGFAPGESETYAADVDGPSSSTPTTAGNVLAEQRGWTAPPLPEGATSELDTKEGR